MNRAEFKDPGLVGELGVQCVESEKLEQALQSNMSWNSYGGSMGKVSARGAL